jgi:hypothetical protein
LVVVSGFLAVLSFLVFSVFAITDERERRDAEGGERVGVSVVN